MDRPVQPIVIALALLLCAGVLIGLPLHAQSKAPIYTCTGKDGSRVFSDEKCGPDARVVIAPVPQELKALTPAKRAEPAAAPTSAQAACESGSLKDCEELYCREGASDECRRQVVRVASVSGEKWYLRRQGPVEDDGTIAYEIRCIEKGVHEFLDLTITCTPGAERNHCFTETIPSDYPRLDQAASAYCATH
jgi:hypothetical protein